MKRSKMSSENELAELKQRLSSLEQTVERLSRIEKEYNALIRQTEKERQGVQEISERRDQVEEDLRMAEVIIENSPVILFRRLADADHRLVYVSKNIRQFGYSPEAFLNTDIHFRDIVHPDDREQVKNEVNGFAERGVEEYSMSYRIVTRDGRTRWVKDRTGVARDPDGRITHYQGIVIDTTEYRQAREKLQKSEEKFRRIVETAGEGYYLMNEDLVITDVNQAFARLVGYRREELLGRRPIDLADDEFRQFLKENCSMCLAKDFRTFEGTFIGKGGEKIPVLVHGSTLRDDEGQTIGHVAFVTNMTEFKKSLALAGEVQKNLLPHGSPPVRGLDVAGKNISCDEIGGDYFDFLWRSERPEGPFSVVVGDITGHGVDAALLMTTARAFLRMRAAQPGDIADIVTEMNRHLTHDVLETGRFMTLFYLSIDPPGGRMEWVRAGHDPALLYDPVRDRFENLMGQGVALGLDEGFVYRGYVRDHLVKGQVIAVGTDGIWESFNPRGEMFGKERLKEIIRRNAHLGADKILAAVYEALARFTQGRRSEDDVTLVIIKATL